ncbi:hypothetical protein [Streptomyces arboris]
MEDSGHLSRMLLWLESRTGRGATMEQTQLINHIAPTTIAITPRASAAP